MPATATCQVVVPVRCGAWGRLCGRGHGPLLHKKSSREEVWLARSAITAAHCAAIHYGSLQASQNLTSRWYYSEIKAHRG